MGGASDGAAMAGGIAGANHKAGKQKMGASNTKLENYVRWKPKLELEEYLEHAHAKQRRLWTKMRGGCLEVRVETGRWERMSVNGQQVAVPRSLRYARCALGKWKTRLISSFGARRTEHREMP